MGLLKWSHVSGSIFLSYGDIFIVVNKNILLLLPKICDSRIHGPPVHSSAWRVGGAQQIMVGSVHAHLLHVWSESSLRWKCQLSFSYSIFRLYFSDWVILLRSMKDDFENQKREKEHSVTLKNINICVVGCLVSQYPSLWQRSLNADRTRCTDWGKCCS